MTPALDSADHLYSENAEIHNHLTRADLPDTEGSFKKTVLGLRNAPGGQAECERQYALCRENREYYQNAGFFVSNGVRYVTCSRTHRNGQGYGGSLPVPPS